MTEQKKIRVLVLCTHNANRSQMAEGLLRALGKGAIEAYSAGLEPRAISENAISVMKEIGINISAQRSKSIDEYLGQSFDYVITVCDDAAERCPFFPGETIRLHWPIEDPSSLSGTREQVMDGYRLARDQIKGKVIALFGEFQLHPK